MASKDADGTNIDSIVELYSAVGDQHNRMLEYMYDKFKTKVDSPRFTPLGTIESSEMFNTISVFLTDSLSASNLDFPSYYFNDSTILLPGASQTSLSNHYSRMSEDTLSPGLRNALENLDNLIRDSTINRTTALYDTLINRYVYPSSYNNTNETALNDTDKAAYVATVSIARHSLQYWHDNHQKWDSLATKIETGTYRNVNGITSRNWLESVLEDMAYADGAGVVTGSAHAIAICASAAGAGTIVIPGLGTVTAGGACAIAMILCHSLGGSFGAGIHGLIRHFISW